MNQDQTQWPGRWNSAQTMGDRYLEMDRHPWHERWLKGLLTVGFAALSAGVLVAHANPATGYELSIYRATPVGFWVGVGLSLLVSLLAAFSSRTSNYLRNGALTLGGGSVLAVVALPIIRGYYFYGAGDAQDHLGWTKDIVAGTLDPTSLLYPGTHLIAISVSGVTGVPLRLGIQYMTLAFFGAYLLFVPLCVRTICDHDWAVSFGVFSALLVLPINVVATHLTAHPSSQTIMILPLILYVVFHYVARPAASFPRGFQVTSVGILLSLSSVTVVFLHPQEALNVLAMFVAVASIQFLYRRFNSDHRISIQQPMYLHTLLLGGVFSLWASFHSRVSDTFTNVVEGILAGTTALAPEVSGRSTSLASVGGSIGELFVKLFMGNLVFCILAGGVALTVLFDRHNDTHRETMITYLSIASVPLVGVFVVFFVSDMGDHHFRILGFMMVPVTILSAVALTNWYSHLVSRLPTSAVRTLAVVFFALLIPLSVVTVHASPYIYQPSSQITRMQVSGYETAFENGAETVEFVGIRGGPELFAHVVYGTERAAALGYSDAADDESVPGRVFNTNLTHYYEEDKYLVVTRADFERDAILYRGFRYSREGFTSLETRPGLHLVQSNGDFRLYLVPGTENGTADSAANSDVRAVGEWSEHTEPRPTRPSVGEETEQQVGNSRYETGKIRTDVTVRPTRRSPVGTA